MAKLMSEQKKIVEIFKTRLRLLVWGKKGCKHLAVGGLNDFIEEENISPRVLLKNPKVRPLLGFTSSS